MPPLKLRPRFSFEKNGVVILSFRLRALAQAKGFNRDRLLRWLARCYAPRPPERGEGEEPQANAAPPGDPALTNENERAP